MNTTDWITNSDLFLHQVFMIVMGFLYAFAFLLGVSYKAINIYFYFVFYPASFALFLRSPKKYLLLLATFIFFIIPKFEKISSLFFDKCVDFLIYSAQLFGSNYNNMSVYLCVVIPLLLYIPFLIKRFDLRTLKHIGAAFLVVGFLYFILIYPNFKSSLEVLTKVYPNKQLI
jgi:hypothetical protein